MITVKKLLIAALGTFVIAASAFAQDPKSKSPKPKIEKIEEVIIRKDGDTKENDHCGRWRQCNYQWKAC